MNTATDIAQQSKLVHVDTIAKIAYASVPFIVALASVDSYIHAAIFVFMSLSIITLGGIHIKTLTKYYVTPLAFIFVGVLVLILSKDYSNALLVFTRSFSAIACVYFVTLNTSFKAIIMLFEKMRVPNAIIIIMELMYRYIHTIYEESLRIRTAQKARLGYNSFMNSIKCMSSLVASVFVSSYMRAERVYASLEARGYNGTITHVATDVKSGKSLYFIALPFNVLIISAFVLSLVYNV